MAKRKIFNREICIDICLAAIFFHVHMIFSQLLHKTHAYFMPFDKISSLFFFFFTLFQPYSCVVITTAAILLVFTCLNVCFGWGLEFSEKKNKMTIDKRKKKKNRKKEKKKNR